MNTPVPLLPGDCLLYSPSSLMGCVIAVKTWTKVSHVEVYAGDGLSFASRDGQGVNAYSFRNDHLTQVLRPNHPFDFNKGKTWFYSKAIGQKYDWLGLLVFTLAVKQGAGDRMFCSEFATRFYRECQLPVWNPKIDADRVSPSLFTFCPVFDTIWASIG